MTAQSVEAPTVLLTFDSRETSPDELKYLHYANEAEDFEHTVHHALMGMHAHMIYGMRRRLAKMGTASSSEIMKALDLLWEVFTPGFIKITGPQIAREYYKAFREAGAGDVDPRYINALADAHAKRIGDYFHESSKESLLQGFNTYVNRRVPERVALDRVLDAYGLTSRQMAGVTSNKALDVAVESSVSRKIKAKLGEYVGTSLRQRLNLFTKQEAHNLDQQAQQVAWMWLVEHGQMSADAEKVWITAKDEKVCKICGPMHGKTVMVGEKFELPDGQPLWVPGAHVNCRCNVRVRSPRGLSVVRKADTWEEKEHPRGTAGRFTRKVSAPERVTDEDFKRLHEEVMARTLELPATDEPITLKGENKPLRAGLRPIKLGGALNVGQKPLELAGQTETQPISLEKPALLVGAPTVLERKGIELRAREAIVLAGQQAENIVAGLKDKQVEESEYWAVTPNFPTPMYGVIDALEFDENGALDLTHGTTFQADPDKALITATKEFQKKVTSFTNYYRGQTYPLTRYKGATNDGIWGDFADPSTLRTAVESVGLHEDDSDNPFWDKTAWIPIDWYNEDGDFTEQTLITTQQFATYANLSPEQMRVTVVVALRGHDGQMKVGSTYYEPDAYGVSSRDEATMDGRFLSTPMERRMMAGIHNIPIRFYNIDPDAIKTKFKPFDERPEETGKGP